MENRTAGTMLMGAAALMGVVVYLFNRALSDIVNASCSHGPTCPMWGSIDFQTNISALLIALVALAGLYLFFSNEKAAARKIPKSGLSSEEKTVVSKISEAEGSIFQSDLVDKTGFTKVKMTRILDRLEGMGIIERKRRGMTNMVILK